jgi:hypothetical protein
MPNMQAHGVRIRAGLLLLVTSVASQLQEPPAFVNEFMLTNGGTSTLCCDSSMVVWPALHDDVCALQCQAVLSKWHWLWITESYLWCHLTHYQ